jgi:hypothetical protein
MLNAGKRFTIFTNCPNESLCEHRANRACHEIGCDIEVE